MKAWSCECDRRIRFLVEFFNLSRPDDERARQIVGCIENCRSVSVATFRIGRLQSPLTTFRYDTRTDVKTRMSNRRIMSVSDVYGINRGVISYSAGGLAHGIHQIRPAAHERGC